MDNLRKLFVLSSMYAFLSMSLFSQSGIAPVFPADGAVGVNVGVIKWSGSPGCLYDIYLGTSANPPLYKDSLQTTEEKPILLELNKKYYWKIVEKKDGKTIRTSKVFSFSTLPIQLNNLLKYNHLVDQRDDKIYATLVAGGKEWMAQNLDYELPDKSWYYENNLKYKLYGRLYGGIAIAGNMNGICPAGWHIPSIEEWEALLNNSGGIKAAGSSFKEASPNYWQASKAIRNNNGGMTVLPAGSRDSKPSYSNLKKYAYFWTSTPDKKNEGNFMSVDFGFMRENATISTGSRDWAYSIRCVKD